MRNILTKLIWSLGIFSLTFQLFAADVLTLSDVRREVLDSNLDIKIQYEKYYQAQKSIRVALGQFLPRLDVQVLRINDGLTLAQAVVPTPSNWFVYQASQEFAVAESFASETLRLNILEGITKNFINIKFQEGLVESAKEQGQLLEDILNTTQARYDLGAASIGEVFTAKKAVQSHSQQIFALESIISAEKMALNIALSRVPTQEYTLGELVETNMEMVPNSVEEGIKVAINNSTELAQNYFLKEGAEHMESSARWSFISFEGIGFDYPALVSIAKSKVRVIEFQGQRTDLKIRNQVNASYEDLDLIDERIEIQKEIITSTEASLLKKEVLFKGGQISFEDYVAVRAQLITEKRELAFFELEKELKKVTLKRQLGFDSSLNDDTIQIDSLEIALNIKKSKFSKNKKVTARIKGSKEALQQIVSVKYTVTKLITQARAVDKASGYALSFKLKKKGTYRISARILLRNGDVLTRNVNVQR